MCLLGGVIGDSVHHVAYARHVRCNVLFYVEIGVKRAGGGDGLDVWGGDKSGSDVAVGCLAEALLWSFRDL